MLGQKFFHAGNTVAADLDADAASYFTGASITDTAEKNLWNSFVTGSKSDGVYSKIKTFHPFLGNSLTTKAYNAINTGLSEITWWSSPTSNADGVLFNGNFAEFTLSGLSANNSGFGIFVKNWGAWADNNRVDFIVANSSLYTQYITIEKDSGDVFLNTATDSNSFRHLTALTGGMIAMQSTSESGATTRLYAGTGGSSLATLTNSNLYTPNTVSFGDYYDSGVDIAVGCVFTTQGLTESEMIALKSRIYTLMTGLGRA